MTKIKTRAFGFWSDLSTFKFDEGSDTTGWIQAMPLGNYTHPIHGPINVTLDYAQRVANGANARVTGQDLDIDYDHKRLREDAAGWVRQAAVRGGAEGGLWLLVEWTKEAAQKIRDKAYKYFSPEIWTVFEDPRTRAKFRDVLRGGALTNRPFLKGILPINLSELSQQDGGPDMDRALLESLATNLGVEFTKDTKDADLQAAVLAKSAESDDSSNNSDDADKKDDKTDDKKDETTNKDDKSGGSDDKKDDLVGAALSEMLLAEAAKNPLVKHLMEQNAANEKRLNALEATNREAGVKMQLAELRTSGGPTLSPAVEKKLTETLKDADPETRAGVLEAVKMTLGKGGIVQLGEVGRAGEGGQPQDETGDKAVKDFEAAIKKLTEADKDLDEADAYTLAAAENPELYEAYRNASYSWKE